MVAGIISHMVSPGAWLAPIGAAVMAEEPVARAAADARAAVDRLLWDRRLRSRIADVMPTIRVGSASATAFLDGIDFPPEAWRSASAFEDSPLGRAAAGVWRVELALPDLADIWGRAPAQALARAHVLLATDTVPVVGLGRPRGGAEVPDDPLHIGRAPQVPAPTVGDRLMDALPVGPVGDMPAVVEAALVHGELLFLRPFAWGSGILARLAARLAMASRGLDPDCLVAVDGAIAARGRPAYARAIRGFSRDREQGVCGPGIAAWVAYSCSEVGHGARLTASLL